MPWIAGVFCRPFLTELLGRSPSLWGVAVAPFCVPVFAGGVVLGVFWERRIDRGTEFAGLRPTPLFGGDPTPAFFVTPSSSSGSLGRLRDFAMHLVRIRA